ACIISGNRQQSDVACFFTAPAFGLAFYIQRMLLSLLFSKTHIKTMMTIIVILKSIKMRHLRCLW
ncbi:hypothetical protein, partial [Escherichia coli]|uniref:hypothetical protein n=1 Tax=Escherichia coli TaxID=562 RepID=UPI0025A58EE3